MPKGLKTAKYEKKKIAAEICEQLGLPAEGASHFKENAGNFIAEYFDTVLKKIARRTGVPPTYLPERERIVWRLLHKAVESLTLALELIGRPTLHYRLETFLDLYARAWEFLLKARLVQENDEEEADLFADPDALPDAEILALAFEACVRRSFPAEGDPVRLNLTRLAELRREAGLHFVDKIPPLLTFLFQAGVRQFERELAAWHGLDLAETIPVGMLFIPADFDPAQFDLRAPACRRHFSDEDLAWLEAWESKLRADAAKLPADDLCRFLLPIDLRMHFTKNPSPADVSALLAEGANVAVRREFNPDVTHVHTTEQVKQRVNTELGLSLSSNDVKILVKVHRVKEKKEFCWISLVNNGRPQYSDAFVEWLKSRLATDSEFLPRARRAYHEAMKPAHKLSR